MKTKVSVLLGVVTVLAILLSLPKVGNEKKKRKPETNKNPAPVLVLEKKNTLVLRVPVTEDSVKSVQQALYKMSASLPNTETIYLFLDTPGGDVIAGMTLVDSMRAIPQEIKTVTHFAASMGFVMTQNLGERLILPSGVLMAHRAFGGAQGQIPGELNTRVSFFTQSVENMEKVVATRMGKSHEEYQRLVKDEYWIEGQRAVEEGVADRVILIGCAADLQDTYNQTIMTFFGPVEVEWSSCPMISAPISVNFSKMEVNSESTQEIQRIKRIIYDSITNRDNFLRDGNLKRSYLQIVK